MVSPLTGKPAGNAVRSDAVMHAPAGERLLASDHGDAGGEADSRADHAAATAALGDRLGHVDLGAADKPVAKAKAKSSKAKSGSGKAGDKAGDKAGKAKSVKPKTGKSKAAPASSHKLDDKPKTHSSEKPA
jgi:hypothetical protein